MQCGKTQLIAVFVLLILAECFSLSVIAQKRKSKNDSAPKICTGGVINGKVLVESKPIYPKAAKEASAEGQIIVMVRVDEKGKVYEANACAGHKLLRQAAVDAAYQTQIAPTVLFDKAVKVAGILLFVFKLENNEGRLVDITARPTR